MKAKHAATIRAGIAAERAGEHWNPTWEPLQQNAWWASRTQRTARTRRIIHRILHEHDTKPLDDDGPDCD